MNYYIYKQLFIAAIDANHGYSQVRAQPEINLGVALSLAVI